MLKLRVLTFLGLCFAVPAQAGLFSDDDARKQIQQVEARVLNLEEQDKQQTKSIFDLQGQIDVLNGELRKLRGQNEELAHGLQEAEKREKDFYVDLDARLRHFEAIEAAAAAKPVDVVAPTVDAAAAIDPDDPAAENRAIETAYGLSKAGNYADSAKTLQAFLEKYPGSVHASNARYWLGSAQFALKDYKEALVTYRNLLKAEPNTAKAPDVLFAIAGCQYELKAVARATATLKQLIADYPDSAAAAKAKKLIAETR
ncbi:MAG: tol-pal system protein YbgF [Gallionella sp.]|nr:tol-pal system protein YbgF [Gallionella sp.]